MRTSEGCKQNIHADPEVFTTSVSLQAQEASTLFVSSENWKRVKENGYKWGKLTRQKNKSYPIQ